jgi:hypothetical protein
MTERPRLRRLGPPAIRQINLGARVQQGRSGRPSEPEPPRRSAKPTFAFYGSAEWKALMRSVIAKRGRRCQDSECRTPNRGQGGKVYGDHVVELRDGGAPLDEGNVLLRLATPCRVGGGGGQNSGKGTSTGTWPFAHTAA